MKNFSIRFNAMKKKSIKKKCWKSLENWSKQDKLSVKQICGGLTNAVYSIKNKENSEKVLFRVFSVPKSQLELDNIPVLDHNISPKKITMCSNWEIEEFLKGYRNIKPQEICKEVCLEKIAKKLRCLHAMHSAEHNVKHNAQHNVKHNAEHNAQHNVKHNAEHNVKHNAEHNAQHNVKHNAQHNVESDKNQVFFSTLRENCAKLGLCQHPKVLKLFLDCKQMIAANESLLQIGFCHNDLHGQNIMIHPKKNKIRFIDFECAEQNFVLYDIANFLTELCFEYTSTHSIRTRKLLDKELAKRFIAFYDETLNFDAIWPIVVQFSKISRIYWIVWATQRISKESKFDYQQFIEQCFDFI